MRPGKRERRALAEAHKLHLKAVARAQAVSDTPIHTSANLFVTRANTLVRGRLNPWIEGSPGSTRKVKTRFDRFARA